MPRGSGSVDKAPDSQRTNASLKLERRKYSFITLICLLNKTIVVVLLNFVFNLIEIVDKKRFLCITHRKKFYLMQCGKNYVYLQYFVNLTSSIKI